MRIQCRRPQQTPRRVLTERGTDTTGETWHLRRGGRGCHRDSGERREHEEQSAPHARGAYFSGARRGMREPRQVARGFAVCEEAFTRSSSGVSGSLARAGGRCVAGLPLLVGGSSGRGLCARPGSRGRARGVFLRLSRCARAPAGSTRGRARFGGWPVGRPRTAPSAATVRLAPAMPLAHITFRYTRKRLFLVRVGSDSAFAVPAGGTHNTQEHVPRNVPLSLLA